MPGYVFLSNSNKPNREEQFSKDRVTLTNVSRPCLENALDIGYKVWFGVNRDNPENLECELPVQMYDSHTYRSVFNLKDNIIAYKNLMKILKDNDIEVIHCNTPIGGTIGRICGRKAKVKHIIYTAHGFHFYKGAPLLNRTIFKWAEMLMAHWTDVIITMNEEDYQAAQKFDLKPGGKVFYVPGVGIDTEAYKKVKVNEKKKRAELGLNADDIILISMGDLVKRKNYQTAIKAVKRTNNSKVHYLICGAGPEMDNLTKLSKSLGIDKQVHFLGFRSDIDELLKISDIFLFTSLQEGLPRSLMEAMASGLPCIVSNIRGNIDLIKNCEGGFLCKSNDEKGFSEAISNLINNEDLLKKMKNINVEKIQKYDISNVKMKIKKIYEEVLLG